MSTQLQDKPFRLQTRFLDRIPADPAFWKLFDHLPGVYFFVKDCQSRFMTGNLALLNRLGLKTEAELIGSCDADYYTEEICSVSARDDQHVLETGEPIIGRIELGFNDQRILVWYCTTKEPLFDADHKIIGLMGMSQVHETNHPTPSSMPITEIDRAIDLIQKNPNQRVSSTEMAQAAGMSARQLRRKFQLCYGMTPQQFERASRIQGASQALLKTTASISEIAIEFGFCDQSSFAFQFRKHTGCSPKEYRDLRNGK